MRPALPGFRRMPGGVYENPTRGGIDTRQGIFPALAVRPLRLSSTSRVEMLRLVSLEIPDVGGEFREGYNEAHDKAQNHVFGDTREQIQIGLNNRISVVIQEGS